MQNIFIWLEIKLYFYSVNEFHVAASRMSFHPDEELEGELKWQRGGQSHLVNMAKWIEMWQKPTPPALKKKRKSFT